MSIAIIGAGVIGLTTALHLLETGFRVKVLAESRGEATCSANAGAIWGPFLSEEDGRTFDWSFRTLEVFNLLAGVATSGVYVLDGVLAADYETVMPDWFQLLDQDHNYPEPLPHGYLCGWRYRVPIVDMPVYLAWLETRVVEEGGDIVRRKVEKLADVSDKFEYVVNCAGMGARELCNDHELVPVKGQLVVVTNPGVTTFFAERGDLKDLFYWMPQGDKVVIGGTAYEQFLNHEPDPHQRGRMLGKAMKIDQRFASAKVLAERVGLRPYRKTVRFGFDDLAPMRVFHNYGHGGSGVSLSWGCAQEVAAALSARASCLTLRP